MVIDKLTYASSESLKLIKILKIFLSRKLIFVKFELEKIFNEFKPEYIMHLAAESMLIIQLKTLEILFKQMLWVHIIY